MLREGNSDRRAPIAIKNYVKNNPHTMGEWDINSKTHVATMTNGDFRNNEKSITLINSTEVYISHTDKNGKEILLKDKFKLEKDENGQYPKTSISEIRVVEKFKKKN